MYVRRFWRNNYLFKRKYQKVRGESELKEPKSHTGKQLKAIKGTGGKENRILKSVLLMQQIGNCAFYWYTGDIKATFNQLSKVCSSENMLNPSLLLLLPCLHVPFDWCRIGPPKFQQCGPTERLFQQMYFGEQVRLKQQKAAC